MHSLQIALGGMNIAGGILVIGSYVQGIRANPANSNALWGGVPTSIIPLYTVCMLLAAAGYFAFSYYVFFRIDPDIAEIGNVFDFKLFLILYGLILFPSALWMPLTFAMLKKPGRALWWAIRITLFVVGLGSLGLLLALLGLEPVESAPLRWLAVSGSVFFCVQTALLDALVWPKYFPVKYTGLSK
ncbi:MAG: hypothetical protein FJ004_06495 [Chloroflexi bacterium]|nr:hypothetical protein [Chloroflexota bacterium]